MFKKSKNNLFVSFNRCSTDNAYAFSLVEILAVLVIISLVSIAVLRVYFQIRTAAAKITSSLDNNILATEVLQKIAEDIDRLAMPGFDTTMTIENKAVGGINKSRLIIECKFYDSSSRPKTFEKVVWLAAFDPDTNQNVLYRSHGGIALEDKIIDMGMPGEESSSQAALQERGTELFIPICAGFSYFKFQAYNGKDFIDIWKQDKLPYAVAASISFAEPVEVESGTFTIPPESIYTRTIAVDRIRKIPYKFVRRDFNIEEPNSLPDYLDKDSSSSEPNQPASASSSHSAASRSKPTK